MSTIFIIFISSRIIWWWQERISSHLFQVLLKKLFKSLCFAANWYFINVDSIIGLSISLISLIARWIHVLVIVIKPVLRPSWTILLLLVLLLWTLLVVHVLLLQNAVTSLAQVSIWIAASKRVLVVVFIGRPIILLILLIMIVWQWIIVVVCLILWWVLRLLLRIVVCWRTLLNLSFIVAIITQHSIWLLWIVISRVLGSILNFILILVWVWLHISRRIVWCFMFSIGDVILLIKGWVLVSNIVQ